MKEFGWTIEYTLSLTYPVFLDLCDLIKRVRYDSAVDEFFTPYVAGKYGGKNSKFLFDGRGSMYLNDTTQKYATKDEDITLEMIEKANEKLRQKINRNNKKLADAVSGCNSK